MLLSLAVSDLGVGLRVQPFFIALIAGQVATTKQESFLSHRVHHHHSFILLHFVLGVVAISVDRFLAIHLHLRYQELVTHKRVVAVVISIWVLSPLILLFFWWIPGDIFSMVAITISGLCLISTTIIYFKIYLAVRRHTNQIQALQVQQVAQNGEMINVARQRKSAISTFYVYLVFSVCYLPMHCTFIVHMISGPSPI